MAKKAQRRQSTVCKDSEVREGCRTCSEKEEHACCQLGVQVFGLQER